MAYGPRFFQAAQSYHITQRGTNQQRVFFESSDYVRYLRFLKEHQTTCAVRILAYCLMPNHIHLIVQPEFDDSIPLFCRRVHGNFARFINLKEGRTGHLWQGRYYCCHLSNDHLRAALRYVEYNPVRANLVDRPEHFQWSSAAAHLGLREPEEILDGDFYESQGSLEGWRALLATSEEAIQARMLRTCTYSGRPFGDESFVKAEGERTGHCWQIKSFSKKVSQATAA